MFICVRVAVGAWSVIVVLRKKFPFGCEKRLFIWRIHWRICTYSRLVPARRGLRRSSCCLTWPKLDLVMVYVRFVFKRRFNISSQCQGAEVYFCTSSFSCKFLGPPVQNGKLSPTTVLIIHVFNVRKHALYKYINI